ncbi:hypothetical protein HOD29_06995 [archaeon]|jgi:hypothetical protein|nr:hypothetical protein [archaeon]
MNPEKYAAEDGLKVLTYLGLTNLTQQEKETLKYKWDEVNKQFDNILFTISELYCKVLPFKCGPGGRESFMVSQYRDQDFIGRIKETGIGEKLKRGQSLEQIFSEAPERFSKWN